MVAYCYVRMCALAHVCAQAARICAIFAKAVSPVWRAKNAQHACMQCLIKFCGARVLAHVAHLQACPQPTRMSAKLSSLHVSASKSQTLAC
eukprot:6212545-Pleurochrysis_carterae.AAC.1